MLEDVVDYPTPHKSGKADIYAGVSRSQKLFLEITLFGADCRTKIRPKREVRQEAQ